MAQKQESQQVLNINERKERDTAITQLAAIVESSGDAILGTTLQGVITSWNSSAEQLFGYTGDEIIGKSASLLFPPDRQEELLEALARIKGRVIVQIDETTRMRKDGTPIEVSVTASPIGDPNGTIIAASIIVHDITEQKRMIEELATRSRELEGSDEELATRSQELERSDEELATRSRELEGSNKKLAIRSRELEGSNKKLATRSRELERSVEELAMRSQELEGSNAKLATRSRELERSNAKLTARSRELERSVEELATRSRELEGSNEELATRTYELERSNEELTARSRELERSNAKLATRTYELEGSVEELATRRHELERSNAKLATRSRELEGSVEELATRRHELEASNAKLATRSRELERSNAKLATRTYELEGSVEELATRRHELERSNEELATRTYELEASNAKLATRTYELEASNAKLATRSRELERSNAKLATRTYELEGSVEELATRSRELERSNAKLATRSQELERASNAAVYQLAAIVESSGDAILGETLQGVITSWNSSAEHLFGYTAAEVLGTSASLLIPADRQEELLEILARIAAGETVQPYETTRVRKDGTLLEVSVTISPIRNLQGSIIAASTITHDISEQKRMVADLMAVNSALEEANRVRSEFLATMSHELRTPLTSIIGFSQMLLDDAAEADGNQQHRNDLERILKNGQHLLSLINDVLDLSKIEAGRMVLTYSQVDVRDLLTSVVEETQSMALARHLVLRAEVAEGIGFLESNPLKLRQVLLNLISNALKFTEQGEVTVSATRVISPESQAEQIVLVVKDSGMGIPADIQAHIFEAFYQADGTYTRKAGGTGLGLSIVNQLTTLLGGTITLESAAGQGSTFTVILPIKAVYPSSEQELPRLHAAQPREDASVFPSARDLPPTMSDVLVAVAAQCDVTAGQNNVVLAVDDNLDGIILIKAALEDTPYTVVGLQDSLQAMELVQELQPCAIMLDVMMPDVNGWQLLHQLKANPATAVIPVIMITALPEPATGYVLGADAYLIKPFNSAVLLNTLQSLLAAQQDHVQVAERETKLV